jgi:tetratricopeptide (TPR) repeat protein
VNSKNLLYRTNLALYEMYAGQFDDAIKEAAEILALDAKAVKAHVAMALSQFALGRPAEAAATYQKLRVVSGRGASMAAIGLADLSLYNGRDSEAAGVLEAGIAEDLGQGRKSSAAVKLAALSAARHSRAQQVEAAMGALALLSKKNGGAAFAAARTLIEQGQEAKALLVAEEMTARLEPEPQDYGKLLEGEAHLAKGRPREAIKAFQEAQKLSDTWLGHLELGRAYLEGGFYTEASSEFDTCLKRKGEATAVFFDDIPSFRYFPQVYYYQARAEEGLKSPGAVEAYRTFLAIKTNAEPGDAMVTDARKRAKALGVTGL